MPVDELAALLRVVTLIADLDPADAWELDTQLAGLAKVTATFAEGLGTWGDRLTEIGLHDSVTAAAATGSEHLSQTAVAFAGARRNLRTVYAAQFAAAEAQVSQVQRRDFWGETPNSGAAAQASPGTPPPAAHDEPAAPAEVQSGAITLPGGKYLDWSCSIGDIARGRSGGSVELGDGTDALALDFTAEKLADMHRLLGLALGDDSGTRYFLGGLNPEPGGTNHYIEWGAPRPDGSRSLEFGEAGSDTVTIDLSRDELQALYEQLTEDLSTAAMAPAGAGEQATVDIGPSALFLGDVNDGAVSWGGRGPAGGRIVEIEDGQDLAAVALTREQMQDLRDRLAATLAGDQDVDARLSGDAGTVTWHADGEDRYRLSVDAGEQQCEVVLTEQQLRAVQQQITTDLAEEAAAAATFPGVTGRLADKHAGVTYDNDSTLTVADGTLTDEQRASCGRAVRLYRNSTYRQVAAYLRGGEDEVMQVREYPDQQEPTAEAVSEHVEQMDRAMQASPLQQPVELWRGVRDLPLVLGTEMGEDLTGAEWIERSFPSTSMDPGVAGIFTDDVLLRLHVPAGTCAIQLDSRPTEREHTREAEVLLQRGLQMRVVADQRQPVGEGRTVGVGGGTQYVPPPEYRVLDVEVTVPQPAVPEPGRSPEEIRPPNGEWGIDQGLMHFDSALGVLWNTLGDDRHLQVDGRALGNVITDLGEGITRRHHDTNDALRELRRVRAQLPDASTAAQRVDAAIGRLDAPDRPAPTLPDTAPQQLKDLMADLNAINLVRRGYDTSGREPFHETDQLAHSAHRWLNGELSRGEFERDIQALTSRRHESSEGWTEIREAVSRALRDFRQWARRPN